MVSVHYFAKCSPWFRQYIGNAIQKQESPCNSICWFEAPVVKEVFESPFSDHDSQRFKFM